MIDQDTDCFVTESEMTSAMRCFGYDQPDLVKAIFSCIDRDEDGKLTRKEYVAGWVNFMLLYVPTAIYAVLIGILNGIYRTVAKKLNDFGE